MWRSGERPPRSTLLCYVDSAAVGGAEIGAATLMASLDPSVAVTVLGHHRPVVERVAAGRPGARVIVVPAVRGRRDVVGLAGLVRAVRRAAPDVVHANLRQPWSGQYGILAAVVAGVPVVAVVNAETPAHRPSQEWLTRRLAPKVSAWVAPSRHMADRLAVLLARPARRITVIPPGVTPPEVVERTGASPGPTLGIVGRLSPEKGVDIGIRALEALPGWRLVVVGDGDERGALEALAAARGVGDRVRFEGWSATPWALNPGFDVLAVPSRAEAFGLVIVEAMFAGVPVVASAVGGIPEVIEDGVNGILVPPDDPAALAAAVLGLGEEGRAGRITRAASARAAAFTPAVSARRFEGLYSAVGR